MKKLLTSTVSFVVILSLFITSVSFSPNTVKAITNSDIDYMVEKASSISFGRNHSAVVTQNGDLYTWGENDRGQLGDGTTENCAIPKKIMSNVRLVSLGESHSAAITNDDSLYMWGANFDGQFGNGTTTGSTTPIKIMENVKFVDLGSSHTAIITNDDNLYTCGWNAFGQLGIGKADNNSHPTKIKILSNVKTVNMGDSEAAAVTTDGSLYTWGSNYEGQLGNGTNENSYTPIKIMDNVKSVSLGKYYAAAIKNDYSLYTWGNSDATKENKSTPKKVMDNVKYIDLGYAHFAAITTNNSLYMWGYNGRGQLGDGTFSDRKTPIKIMENVSTVGLGGYHSGVITNEGDLYVFGYNTFGQVGDGTTEDRKTPKKIMSNMPISNGNLETLNINSLSGDSAKKMLCFLFNAESDSVENEYSEFYNLLTGKYNSTAIESNNIGYSFLVSAYNSIGVNADAYEELKSKSSDATIMWLQRMIGNENINSAVANELLGEAVGIIKNSLIHCVFAEYDFDDMDGIMGIISVIKDPKGKVDEYVNNLFSTVSGCCYFVNYSKSGMYNYFLQYLNLRPSFEPKDQNFDMLMDAYYMEYRYLPSYWKYTRAELDCWAELIYNMEKDLNCTSNVSPETQPPTEKPTQTEATETETTETPTNTQSSVETQTNSTEKSENTTETNTSTPTQTTRRIYLNKFYEWSNPYVYFWSDNNTAMISWPGVPMIQCENYYYMDVPESATYIIFSDCGTPQTIDIKIPAENDCFTLTSLIANKYTGEWSKFEWMEETTEPTTSDSTVDVTVPDKPVETIVIGDANADGSVNIKDVTQIQMYVVKLGLDKINLLNCDLNKDEVINIRDATYLQMALVGLIKM